MSSIVKSMLYSLTDKKRGYRMIVDNSIFIFANSYSCPLDKRCDNCVFEEMSKMDKHDLYKSILKMENKNKLAMVEQCKSCQACQSPNTFA